MAVDVVSELVIQRPIGTVSEYAAQPDNAPVWYQNIESVEWETEPPLAVGSRVVFVARFLGRRLEYTYEIRQFEPGSRLVMATSQGPFPMETTYTWTAEGASSTRMRLRNRGQPSGFSKMTAPVLAAAMQRANQKDLDNLRSILERGNSEEVS
jgi:uncharacterized membrane protein